ncbi:MAG: ribonuclease HII [Bacteroidota bacterium]
MSQLLSFFNENLIEAGCDEAGRGCLAGPVVAAAVILPKDFHHKLLDDSKKTTEKSREILRKVIEEEALSWNVQFISHEVIDEINILNASILGMQQAALDLDIRPEFVLIDGNRFHKFEIPHQTFIKGDGRYKSIAAASILAKTHRDEFMDKIADKFPEYNWKKNKAYPTLEHRLAVKKYGLSEFHRKSFQLKNMHQLELKF